MPLKSAPMTQASIRRMIKESINAAIATERARQVNVKNDASGSGPVREGKKVKFVAATLEGPALKFCPIEEVQRIEHELWNLKVKEYDVVAYTQRFNELALMCPRMVEPERVKVDAYIRGLTNNIKGEVTSSKPANLNEAVRMAHKLMEQKSQARDAKFLEGKTQKIAKSKEIREPWLPLLLMESFLCVNDVLLTMLVSVQSSATSVERLGIRQGHTRKRCLKKVKQKEVGEVCGLAYAIKDVEPQGLNVVTDDSYEVELADRRIVSTNTILKGCTLSLVNHVFEIDLMSIELGTFDVIIGMDWLVKHDAVIVYGEKVVRIPYGNKTLIVEGDKGVSRLKVISCIKACKCGGLEWGRMLWALVWGGGWVFCGLWALRVCRRVGLCVGVLTRIGGVEDWWFYCVRGCLVVWCEGWVGLVWCGVGYGEGRGLVGVGGRGWRGGWFFFGCGGRYWEWSVVCRVCGG
ncbi:putative reverse transcriptase domain-containing protein [Tanacetum coccineum]